MHFKNLKIGTQLKLGFALLMFFVLLLGSVSYWQSGQIYLQSEAIYSHSIKVRSVLSDLKIDILNIRLSTRDLILAKKEKQKQEALLLMELSVVDANRQFNILYNQYLGPRKDIDEAYKSFLNWRIA